MKDWNSKELKVGDKVQYKTKQCTFFHIGYISQINQNQYFIILSSPYKQKIYLSDCLILEKIN